MYGHNYRNSSLAAEEIQVLKAISRVSEHMAQKLAALDNQRQTKEGETRNVKTSGYAMAIQELHDAAAAIDDVADWLTCQFSSPAPKEPKPKPVPTLEQVRAVLAEKSRAGYTAAVRELLRKQRAEKLSLVDPQHYEDLLKDVEALANAT